MTADSNGNDLGLQLAFQAVTLYHDRAYLDTRLNRLRAERYHIVELACGEWTTEAAFHRDVAAAFDLPDYYGGVLASFDDCMYDVARHDYGTDPTAAGTVLVLVGYDVFAHHDPKAAFLVLDIFAARAGGAALLGHRMFCLVQSNDRALHFEPVGAIPVGPDWGELTMRRRRV